MLSFAFPSAIREGSNKDSMDPCAFLVDATNVLRSSAYTAVLSHACAALMACTTEVTRSDESRWPAASEVSVETAQKRAYANNCWSVLLRMRDQRGATDFIAEMAALARTDTLVLVSSNIRHGCSQPGFPSIPCTEGKNVWLDIV